MKISKLSFLATILLSTVSNAGTTPDDEEGFYTCIPCPAGTYLSGNECKTCPAGTYSGGGATSCISCPAGTYTQEVGASDSGYCKTCPAGYACKGGANIEVCDGNAGKWAPAGSTSCQNCEIVHSDKGDVPWGQWVSHFSYCTDIGGCILRCRFGKVSQLSYTGWWTLENNHIEYARETELCMFNPSNRRPPSNFKITCNNKTGWRILEAEGDRSHSSGAVEMKP